MFDASQGPQTESSFEVDINEDLTEEATPLILLQDPLEVCLAHFRMDDFDVDGYIDEMNTLLEPPTSKTTLPWTIKYEPFPELASIPITPSLESPPT